MSEQQGVLFFLSRLNLHEATHPADIYVYIHIYDGPPVALLSILAARAIAVPLSPAFPVPELEYVLNHSEASLLVSSAKFASKAQQVLAAELASKPAHLELPKHAESADAAREEVPLEDGAEPGRAGLMLYTSGTTNKPVREL